MTQDQAGQLSMQERIISSALGLVLAAAAAKPRPSKIISLLALAGGAALAYRGSTGFCPLKAALADGRNTPLVNKAL